MKAGDGRAAAPVARRRGQDSLTDASDEALMARIAGGDRDAARELMARRLPRIHGLARRILSDPHEAEDVAQETFVRVWKAAGRWEAGRASVAAWMARIATNLCYDRLRKRREIHTDTPPEHADPSPDPEARLAGAEGSRRIAAAIAQLPDRQREAIELVHFQEVGNIEAAALLETSVEAVESLLARGRRKLRAILLEEKEALLAQTGTGQVRRTASAEGSKP